MELTRPLSSSDRLRLAPAATRALGADLLVSVGGATRPVERLAGSGPVLWHAFAAGLTIAEAARELAERSNAAPDLVEAHVL
ncbi:MAG TPA: hypothetical protein VGA36_07220, partial [Nitriliruptorales bacterium]